MEEEQRAEILPPLLAALEGKPTSHQDSLLLLMLPALGEVTPPENDDRKREFLGLKERPQVARLLNEFLLNYLLIPYGTHPSICPPPPPKPMVMPGMPPPPPIEEDTGPKTPACMCDRDWKRVAGETPTKAEVLEKNKVKVVKFLGSGMLETMEVALPLLVAASDTRHSVATQADTEIRRQSGGMNWEDPALIAKVYSLFLGTLAPKNRPQPKPELKLVPANTRIRLKLIHTLLKSREAATTFPAGIQVTFDLLFGQGGNTNAKLRMLAVTMIHHIVYNCPAGQRLNTIGPVLLSALIRLVNEEKDVKLRASCYIAIGKLGLKVPHLVNKDVSVIQTFFEAISREDKDTQLSVQEAMSMMAPSFRKMDPNNLKFMEAMLCTYVENDEHQVRLVAVQYAGEVFSTTHVTSRYILLLGSGDAKEVVAKEAINHLYGTVNKLRQQNEGGRVRKSAKEAIDKKDVLPDFVDMLKHVLAQATIRAKTQKKHVIADKVLAFHPTIYVEILNFLRLCLATSAGAEPSKEALEEPEYAAPAITRYLSKMVESSSEGRKNVEGFIEFADKLLSATHGAAQALCMLQLVGVTCKTTAGSYVKRINWLKGMLDNTREDIRETVANLYGLVLGQVLDRGDFEKAITDLCRSFKEKSLEFQHGIVMALGFSFGRKILLTRINSPGDAKNLESWGSYKGSAELIVAQLNSSHSLMMGAACTAIAELGRCGPLPLKDGGGDEEEDGDLGSKYGLCKKLLAMVKSGKVPMRVREKAALALGQLSIGEDGFKHSR
jgi:proteasome component ECM29